MKLNICLILSLLVSLKALREYSDAHILSLKDSDSTIDGIELIEEPIFGVSYKKGGVYISGEGTYIVSGLLNGNLNIATDNKVVKLVLNGVTINSDVNAITFEKGYELIDKVIDKDPSIIKNYDFNNAGAQIIIADDTLNYCNGDEDGKQNGAIYSNITLHITGEEKGTGKLYITSRKEGIEVMKHLCISGGYINVAADDDGINSKTNKDSVIYVKGGKVLVNSGLGAEGDGFDGNGFILIDGGEVISAASPMMDSGLDSNSGTFINGGTVYAVGTSMDMAEKESSQSTMNLIFNERVNATSCISIKKKGEDIEIISYNATQEDFIAGTARRDYSAAVVSHPSFKEKDVYNVYLDGKLQGFTSNDKVGPGPGPGPDPGPGPIPPGPPPGNLNKLRNHLSSNEEKELKSDFVLGKGAIYFSGIQEYHSNNVFYLTISKNLLALFALMIINI